MKKSILLFVAVLSTALAFAQAPNKMSYQSIVRSASGTLIANQAVAVKISIRQSTATGTTVYSERHTLSTNANGLATLQIGNGAVLSGSFASINWGSGTYFVQTETDPNGGTSYTIDGTQQLLSVPYALNAKTADALTGGVQWTTTGNDIYNSNSGNVGIGTSTPSGQFHLNNYNDDAVSNTAMIISNTNNGNTNQASISLKNYSSFDRSLQFWTNNSQATSTTKMYQFLNNTASTEVLSIRNDGRLTISGGAYKPGGGSWTATSDRRLKDQVVPYADGLTLLMSIKPVKFHYNELSGIDTEKEYVGVIAQDLNEVAPYMVGSFEKEGETYFDVDNSAMTYMLINAVQEQQATIEELQLQLLEMKKLLEEITQSK